MLVRNPRKKVPRLGCEGSAQARLDRGIMGVRPDDPSIVRCVYGGIGVGRQTQAPMFPFSFVFLEMQGDADMWRYALQAQYRSLRCIRNDVL
jgi:hypothetical protein